MSRGVEAREAAGLAAGAALGLLAAYLVAALTPAGGLAFFEALATVYTRPALLGYTVLLAAPIAASAIGLSIAYRAGFITIGSEGQVLIGAAAALGATAYLGLSGAAGIAASVVLAAVLGGLLGLAVGVLRAYMGVNEVLSSLMINYVVLYLINYLVSGPWRAGAFTLTRSVPEDARVSPLATAVVLIALAVAYHLLLARTRLGFYIEAYGGAPRAAATYGVNWRLVVLAVSLLSGVAAGIGGALMMLGFQHSFTALSTSPGYGYMGILVAWLSLTNPLASLAAGFFFASLGMAVRLLQAENVRFGTVLAIQAVVVLLSSALVALSRRRSR